MGTALVVTSAHEAASSRMQINPAHRLGIILALVYGQWLWTGRVLASATGSDLPKVTLAVRKAGRWASSSRRSLPAISSAAASDGLPGTAIATSACSLSPSQRAF